MEEKPDAAARLRAGADRNGTSDGGKDERCDAPEAALRAGADRNGTPDGGKDERCGAPEVALRAGDAAAPAGTGERRDVPGGPAAGGAGRRRTLAQLFFATLYISACTFGGGFVIVTFMKRRFVDRLHWIDEQEMLDLTALAQSSPGAIAVNAAILVGWRVAGFAGMLVATLGTILPPMLILSAVSLFYHAFAANRYVALALKGMQAGVAAVILDVVCNLGGPILRQRSPLSLAVMAAAFVADARGYRSRVTENAAEVALEHHLGITCDPVQGYVQIPCIERNAMGAIKAYNAAVITSGTDPYSQRVSLDAAIAAMAETGREMSCKFKETSLGGLAVSMVAC